MTTTSPPLDAWIRTRAGRRAVLPVVAALFAGLLVAGPAPLDARAEPGPAWTSVEPRITGRYLSEPPRLTPPAPEPTTSTLGEPAAPTRGTVRGRVVGPDGRPRSGVEVRGLRSRDLRGLLTGESEPTTTRTDAQGRFALPQYTEPYLVSFCAVYDDEYGCAGDLDVPRPFVPTYTGPDGTSDSWLTQTRLFAPARVGRDLGTVRMRPYAELSGTFVDGAYRSVRLLRGDGSVAGAVTADENGTFRFFVAPGRYRVEADRIQGFATVATVIGFRSRTLDLRAGRPATIRVQTRPAAEVYGLVTAAGVPVADEFLTITDARGRFAGGVVTDAGGRYRIDALQPGRYRIATTYVVSQHRRAAVSVTLSRTTPTRADLEVRRGAVVTFAPVDPDPATSVAVELRDAAGQAVKIWDGSPADYPDGTLAFSGLAPGRYTLLLRRQVGLGEDPVDLPWASRSFTVTGDGEVALGRIRLDRVTLRLTGTLPRHGLVKVVSVPADEFRRGPVIEGVESTPIMFGTIGDAGSDGRYAVTGLVPGRYVAMVSSDVQDFQDAPSVYRGNLVVSRYAFTVPDVRTVRRSFAAPVGGVLRGRLRYAGHHRLPITSFGLTVRTRPGPSLALLPTVSALQPYHGPFRADRLRGGAVTAELLSPDVVLGGDAAAVPETLRNSARRAQSGTPYWLEIRPVHARVRPRRVTEVGWVDLHLRR